MLADNALAELLVREAAEAARPWFRRPVTVEWKGSAADPVSQADRAAEERVEQLLAQYCPRDGLLGEEGTSRSSGNGRSWLLDPLDGTINFLGGQPLWCSQIALLDEQGPRASAVYDPLGEELCSALRGQPLRLNGKDQPLLQPACLQEASLGTYIDRNRYALPGVAERMGRMMAQAATVRMPGAGGLIFAWTALGRLDAAAFPAFPTWDCEPGALLVQCAGGSVHRLAGETSWIVAGRPQLADQLADLLS